MLTHDTNVAVVQPVERMVREFSYGFDKKINFTIGGISTAIV